MFGWSPAISRFFQATAIICMVCILSYQDTFATWQRVGTFTNRFVGAGFFFNANRGIITLDGISADSISGTPNIPPQILRTYNGGQTWLPSLLPPGYNGTAFNDIFMKYSLNGWVVFEVIYFSNNLLRTTYGGVSWFEVQGYVEEATAVYETSKGVMYTHRGLRFGSDRGLFISKDQGTSFGKLENVGLNGLDFVDDDHGVASTFNSTTLFTNDGGDTWNLTNQITEAWGVYGEKGTPNFVIAGEQRSNSFSTTTTIVRSTDFVQ